MSAPAGVWATTWVRLPAASAVPICAGPQPTQDCKNNATYGPMPFCTSAMQKFNAMSARTLPRLLSSIPAPSGPEGFGLSP